MKSIRTFAGILCFSLILASFPGHAATPEETAANEATYRALMDEGIGLLKTGDIEEVKRATAKFKSALRIEPESAEAYYWMGLCFSDRGIYMRAADNAKEATVYDDKMAEAYSLWGQSLLYLKQWENARDTLEIALRLSPDDPIALYNLGRVHYHGFKDPTSALANFRTAWQRSQSLRRENPDYAPLSIQSRLYMGLCEYDRGRSTGNDLYYNNAINAFQDVLKEQPTNYDAAMRLAMAYRKSNRASDSKILLDQIHTNLTNADPSVVDRHLFAEINLQLADLYLKDPVMKDRVWAVHHLRQFVAGTGESNHPALEPAKEFLSQYDPQAGGDSAN